MCHWKSVHSSMIVRMWHECNKVHVHAIRMKMYIFGVNCGFTPDYSLGLFWKIEDTMYVSVHPACFTECWILLFTQRVSTLCKLLGHTEQGLQKALASLSSSESMDFQALLLGDGVLNQNGANPNLVRRESDTESGFEDGNSSQMSKSLDGGGVLTASDSIECLQIEQILTELMSIATEWKSLRNVKNCSCAMPFEQYTKKVCWRQPRDRIHLQDP